MKTILREDGLIKPVLLLIILAVVVYLFPHRTIGLFGRFLVVDDTPRKANAIIVLLGNESRDRVVKAYELHRDGLAPLIVFGSGYEKQLFTDAYPNLKWISTGEQYTVAFRSLGVPGDQLSIVDTGHAYDTASELRAIARAGRKSAWAQVILVTSEPHTRRVSMIWRRVAPDIPSFTIAAPQHEFSRWWSAGYNRRSVIYEYLALGKELGLRFRSFVGTIIARLRGEHLASEVN